MRDCGCSKRRGSLEVRTRRYIWEIEGRFCHYEIEALLDAIEGIRDVVIEEKRFSFQADREFDKEAFLDSLRMLGIEVKRNL